MVQTGDMGNTFPAPLKIGRMSGWRESKIQQWIASVAAKQATALAST
jgi:predicted DNA-binding transcriptional regulator AlpA